MKQEQRKPKLASIYDYDIRIERTYKLMEKDISANNVELIRKYDRSMIGESLAKATRLKHLQVILNLSFLMSIQTRLIFPYQIISQVLNGTTKLEIRHIQ
jgi:hypothetical protein